MVLEGGRCCVVVLCSLNVFGCVNRLLHSFVLLYLFDCMVCGIEGLYVELGDCLVVLIIGAVGQ